MGGQNLHPTIIIIIIIVIAITVTIIIIIPTTTTTIIIMNSNVAFTDYPIIAKEATSGIGIQTDTGL